MTNLRNEIALLLHIFDEVSIYGKGAEQWRIAHYEQVFACSSHGYIELAVDGNGVFGEHTSFEKGQLLVVAN